MKIIFFGAGYCSRFIIPNLPKNFQIICTHNKKVREEEFDRKYNLTRVKFEDFLKKKEFYFKNTTHLLNSVPPNKNGDLVLEKVKDLLIKKSSSIKWYGYFSSTSVYGNHFGNWVNENSNTNPSSLRGENRLKAEKQNLDFFSIFGLPIHIFRLPGIYGPGRSIINKLKSEKFLLVEKRKHFFSRIHVEDISSAILKSLMNPTPGEIFNITDDYPCELQEITQYACRLMKIPLPEKVNFSDERLNKKTSSFYLDNKKVLNNKIKKILGWTPKFRNYKLGLKKIYKDLSQ